MSLDTIRPSDRASTDEENIRIALDSFRRGIATAIVAKVVKFHPAANTVDCQPVTNGTRTDETGTEVSQPLPLLASVPVVFPGGGGLWLTFPILEGDACLVVFCGRDFDGWWATGKQSDMQSTRSLDYSDGVAIFGLNPAQTPLPSISTAAAELRNASRSCRISITPAGAIDITAPGGLSVHADITHTGSQATSGDVTASGKSLAHHVHTGVNTGSDNTGQPL